jgi:hypothetical protein
MGSSKNLLSLFIYWLCIAALIRGPLTPLIRTTRAEVVPGKSKLLKHDRTRLVEAFAQNKPNVTLVIAARQGMNDSVVAEIRKLQGTVQYRDDDVDYLRVEIPTRHVLKLSSSTAIEAINLTGKIDYLSYPEEENETPTVGAVPKVRPPDRDTPPVNPYLPSGAIGAPQFIAAHPTFDGRGVVVAVIDSNIDLLLPELQTAKALDGTTVPKLADIVSAARNAIVQVDDDSHIGGYLRVDMRTEVTTNNAKLSYQNREYLAPSEGKYRLGTLNERTPTSAGDLNRDGNPAGSNALFDILWNEDTNMVWVDTNQNFNFADEKPMTEYSVRHDIGVFGKDDPQTTVRETVGFTLQTDRAHKLIFLVAGYAPHGTGVSGAAFGAGFFGGKLNGVAPGAQIIALPAGRGTRVTGAFIEAAITAVKDPRVDLVSMQFGNFVHQNDGRSTFALICNRLVSKYGKLILAGAGNGTDALNGVISPADAKEVMAVGSYLSRETSRVNYGVEFRDYDNMNGYTSRGPTKDGALKPNLLAPTTSLTTRPGFLPGENGYKSYSLPPGYQVLSGTSTSTPFASAGVALLISAAKQSGVKHDARRLRWAIMSSARFLPKYSPEIQGAGLLQVQAAWEALKNAPEPIEIISRAPVKAVLSENLQQPNQGAGIFEREGWIAGQSGRRTISLTRISGGPGPMKFQLRWLGNDGTFTGPPEISLPLNTRIEVDIAISPKTSGVHSALLNLVSLSGAVVHQIMNTVVAAEQLNAHNGFTLTRSGEAEWLHSQSYFVNVPPNTPALKVDVQIAEGNVMPSLTRPNGRFYYSLAPDQFPVRYTRHQNAGAWSRVVSNPDPGVWQITIDNCDISERPVRAGRASFTVTTALLGVAIQAADFGNDLLSGLSQTTQIRYTNSHGSFDGEIAKTGLASVFATNLTFTSTEPTQYEIDVVPGTTRVGANVATREGTADVDLYLFDCTAGECTLRDFSTGTGSSEQVAVDSPTAGKWKVIIDPFRAGDRRNSFQYKDYLLHPAYGRIDAQNDPKPVIPGAVVTQPVNLKLGAVPVSPRYLEAMLLVIARPGPNTDTQKRSGILDLYYPDQAVLGTASIELKLTALHSTRK